MNDKIDFLELKNNLKNYKRDIIILSTDIDPRFDEAKKILENEVKTIKYVQISKEFIKAYDPSKKAALFDLYKELRSGKEIEEILKTKFEDPNYFANLMVAKGWADGIVSGATHPTADILRPAFQIVKTKNVNEIISSFMWMKKNDSADLFMADISVNPNPDAKTLADIAIQTANSVEKMFEVTPVIAMLSFSTLGSGGKNEMITKIQEATKLVKTNSKFDVVGEIQFDAAYNPKIFAKKVQGATLAKMPNVFIFPDLNAGNIGYKIGALLGSYDAVGPLLQNIARPINDLSRGANPREIADLVILTALQAIK